MTLKELIEGLARYKIEYEGFTINPFAIYFSIIDLSTNKKVGTLALKYENNKLSLDLNLEL